MCFGAANDIKKVKGYPQDWRNYLQIIYLIRYSYPKYIKNSYSSIFR